MLLRLRVFGRALIVLLFSLTPALALAQDITPDWLCEIKHTSLLASAPDAKGLLIARQSKRCRDCQLFDHAGICHATVLEIDAKSATRREWELLGSDDLNKLQRSKDPEVYATHLIRRRWAAVRTQIRQTYAGLPERLPKPKKPRYRDSWRLGRTGLRLALKTVASAEGQAGTATGPRVALVISDERRNAQLDWASLSEQRRLEALRDGRHWSRVLPSSVHWNADHQLLVRCYSDNQSRGCRSDTLQSLRKRLGEDGLIEQERRIVPRGSLNPTVVTKRLIRGIVARKWPLDRFVDPARGVVFLELITDGEPRRRARHLCGKKLAARLKATLAELKRHAQIADEFWCRNKPHQRCALGTGGEFETSLELWFRRGSSRGVELDTIFRRNSTYRKLELEQRFSGRHHRRLQAERCSSED
jgi:hypothetical protein